jgi:hypothetical protein
MNEMKTGYRILMGKPEGKNHYEDLDLSGE